MKHWHLVLAILLTMLNPALLKCRLDFSRRSRCLDRHLDLGDRGRSNIRQRSHPGTIVDLHLDVVAHRLAVFGCRSL
jgi:hypothetical protein